MGAPSRGDKDAEVFVFRDKGVINLIVQELACRKRRLIDIHLGFTRRDDFSIVSLVSDSTYQRGSFGDDFSRLGKDSSASPVTA